MRALATVWAARYSVFIAGLFVLLTPLHLLLAERSDLIARLTKIRAEVTATDKVIAGLKEEFSKLKSEERKLEQEIQKLSDEEQTLLTESTQVLRRKEKLLVDLRAAEQRVAQQQALIRDRLRILYMTSAVSDRAMILSTSQQRQLERVAVYSGSIRRHDHRRFQEVSKAVEELVLTRSALDKALDEAKGLQEKIQAKRGELEGQKSKLREVIQQIQIKQQSAKRSLDTLTGEAEKLEALLRVIMSADGVEPFEVDGDRRESPTPLEDSGQREQKTATEQDDSAAGMADVMHPGGLFAQTARVSYPVTGEVVQRFGANKVTSFADMVFSKGVEYKTPEGSQVRAVLGGKVAFSGVMPGFDTVVIIDHGERSYSLYGRLGKSHVKQGDFIQRKDVLGVTSATDTKGRNFYFETRKNGAPVDPLSVLSRATTG
jgi:septal ring factor EnvC (AmiA/AmiB activator)